MVNKKTARSFKKNTARFNANQVAIWAAREFTTGLVQKGHELCEAWVSKNGELWVTDRAYKVRMTKLYNRGIQWKGAGFVLADSSLIPSTY